jgi:hypothetical protein
VRVLLRPWFPAAVAALLVALALLCDWAARPAPSRATYYHPKPAPMSRVHARSFPPVAQYLLGARNSTGAYTLPTGNPVVSGTIISSTWANNTLSDIATTLQASLDRSGNGGMLAQLGVVDGSAILPGVFFENEVNTGIRRVGSQDVVIQMDGGILMEFHPQFIQSNQQLYVNSANTPGSGSAVIGSPPAGGAGVYGFGPASGIWPGVFGNASNGSCSATGPGVVGLGCGLGGLGAGVIGYAGGQSTGAVRYDSFFADGGDIDMQGVANPYSDAGIQNRITPLSFVKGWANISLLNGSGCGSGQGTCTPTINGGMNVFSVLENSSGQVVVNWSVPFANAGYARVLTSSTQANGSTPVECLSAGTPTSCTVVSTASLTSFCQANSSNACVSNPSGSTVNIMAIGAQ